MYLHTLGICDFETENAEQVLCHLKFSLHRLFSFIKRSELFAIMSANRSSEIFGERDKKK